MCGCVTQSGYAYQIKIDSQDIVRLAAVTFRRGCTRLNVEVHYGRKGERQEKEQSIHLLRSRQRVQEIAEMLHYSKDWVRKEVEAVPERRAGKAEEPSHRFHRLVQRFPGQAWHAMKNVCREFKAETGQGG